MIQISPQVIKGNWDAGYALDKHSLSSECISYNEYGYPQFDTKYSPLGELIVQLKYRNNLAVLEAIVDTIVSFIKYKWLIYIDLILPTPPSKTDRLVQPVEVMADRVGRILKVEVSNNVLKKVKDTKQLKSITDQQERTNILKDAFQIVDRATENKNILLLDDLYDSGTTLNIITGVLKKYGKPNKVYILACTKTRV